MPGEEGKPFQYFAPVRLGYRQLPIERWTAAPLYRLKLTANAASPDSQRKPEEVPRPPFTVNLRRPQPEENLDAADKNLADREALKEELKIGDVTADGGHGGLKRLFSLTLETLLTDDGYWLDTGILTI
jgi:hypothetical protein